ncbi:MAG: hypothetical protein QOJ12_3550 [Thermoleophilales bacterium]|nr:hypothetical protein [Thermoleophilales bacterium]
MIARFLDGINEHAVLLGKPVPGNQGRWIVRSASVDLRNPAKGQSEVPDVLEEGTYPKALWFVSRAYLRAVKGSHQRGDVEERLGYYVGQLGR